MKRLLRFKLNEGRSIDVEVDESATDGGKVSSSRAGKFISEAPLPFDIAVSPIKPMATVLLENLSDLPSEPAELEIEFGVKLSGETGIVIASSPQEGNFLIKLKWASRRNDSYQNGSEVSMADIQAGRY